MKKLFYFGLLLVATAVSAQTKNTATKETVEEIVTTVPEFPGGQTAFKEFFLTNFQLQDMMKADGKIIVSFIVEADGSLSDVKLLRDAGPGSGQETLRVMGISPKWLPATKNDVAIRAPYNLQINLAAKAKLPKP